MTHKKVKVLESDINNGYSAKLIEALDLVLNDLPDHQDDTLTIKCIDSLKSQLKIEFDAIDLKPSSVNITLKTFLIEKIIENDTYLASLVEKEFEIIQFFFNLIAVYIEIFKNDSEFLIKAVKLLGKYLKTYFESHFILQPTICCSILNLFSVIYDAINIYKSCDLPEESVQLFNQTIISDHTFSQKTLRTILQADCKSIFVKKSYKQLLKKHLIYMIERDLNNDDTPHQFKPDQLHMLINNLGPNMPIDIRMHNFDIISDLIDNFLVNESGKKTNDKDFLVSLDYINELYCKFEFGKIASDQLFDTKHLINDASIESLTTIIGFRLYRKAVVTSRSENSKDTDEIFNTEINKICRHFSSNKSSQVDINTAEAHIFAIFIKSSDLLFKFLMYLYTFLEKLKFFTITFNELLLNIDSVNEYIEHLFIMPLSLNLNASHESIIDQTYLEPILGKPFKYKQMMIKQCLVNIKLFIRKNTSINLFKFLTIDQTAYILRNLSIESYIKNNLLMVQHDYFVKNKDAMDNKLKEICTLFIDIFQLKVNDEFNENIFKIIGIQLTKNYQEKSDLDNNEIMNTTNKIIDLVNSHLKSIFENDKKILFSEQFEIVLKFITDLLSSDVANLNFVNKLLNSDEYFILKTCVDYVTNKTSSFLCEIETLADVQDTIYIFCQNLFESLTQTCFYETEYLEKVFNSSFIATIEEISLKETEAFIRRESIKFQAKYRLYRFKLELDANKEARKWNHHLSTVFNHFSRFLINDFDWQVQIYCLDYFQELFKLIFKNIDKCGYKILLSNLSLNQHNNDPTFIEILCFGSDFFKSILNSIDDYDMHVINFAAKFLSNLNSHEKFINLLEAFDRKDDSFWSAYYSNLNEKIIGSHLNLSNQRDCLKNFLDLKNTGKLKRLIEESEQTTDLYMISPVSILDDIISSYRFDLEDEKHIDCY